MRFVQTGVLALGGLMYAGFFAYSVTVNPNGIDFDSFSSFVMWSVVVWNVLLLAAFIVAIVNAVRSVRAKQTRQLGTVAMVVKLVAIPFFVCNFVLLAVAYLGGFTIIILAGPELLAIAVGGTVLTYLAMLSTSVPGWAATIQLRRERVIPIVLVVVYSVMLCLFFTDIAAGVMLFGHSRRRPRLTVLLMLIVLGVVLTALGIVGLCTYPAFDQSYLQKDHELDGLFRGTNIALIVLGAIVIVVPALVGTVRRSSLRLEAQRAVLAAEPRTELSSTTSAPQP